MSKPDREAMLDRESDRPACDENPTAYEMSRSTIMTTQRDEEALALYIRLMEEVKGRAFSINALVNSQITIGPPLIREYCFLQLRMLCELIALGCLVAHGDITNTKYFQRDAYKADDILHRLEKLHSDFYPIPSKITFHPGGGHLEPIVSGFLTKSELISLYGRCGDVLHKGTLDRIISPPPFLMDYQHIVDYGQKLLNLMSVHRISRIGGKFHYIVALRHTDAGGNVTGWIAEN
jgi:hypothetical protein